MTDLRAEIEKITDLPTLPDVVAKVNQLVGDPNSSAADINAVISRDPALSAKVLKLVNSPFYGFPRRITSIQYAVVILGFRAIRNLTLSVFMFDLMRKGIKGFDMKAFWRFCVASAVAGQCVAKRAVDVPVEDAFMAGLLHDVGKVIMNQFFTDDLKRVAEKVRAEDCLFTAAEAALLDYDHGDVGGLLLERWNLPPVIVEAVAQAHAPSAASPENKLVAVVHMADLLARALRLGDPGDTRVPPLDRAAWDALGLDEESLGPLMDDILAETERSDALMDMS